MTRRAPSWPIIAGSAALGGLVVAGGALAGFVNASPTSPDRPVSSRVAGTTWEVAYTDPQGHPIQQTVATKAAECHRLGDLVGISAPAGGTPDVFRALGNPRHLTAITLRFGDLVYLARANPRMYGNTLRLDHRDGQIHRWTDGAPGDGVSPDATLTGTITCERMAE